MSWRYTTATVKSDELGITKVNDESLARIQTLTSGMTSQTLKRIFNDVIGRIEKQLPFSAMPSKGPGYDFVASGRESMQQRC